MIIETISGSIWYYNVDAGAAAAGVVRGQVRGLDKYTQVYVDGAYNFGVAKIAAQYV